MIQYKAIQFYLLAETATTLHPESRRRFILLRNLVILRLCPRLVHRGDDHISIVPRPFTSQTDVPNLRLAVVVEIRRKIKRHARRRLPTRRLRRVLQHPVLIDGQIPFLRRRLPARVHRVDVPSIRERPHLSRRSPVRAAEHHHPSQLHVRRERNPDHQLPVVFAHERAPRAIVSSLPRANHARRRVVFARVERRDRRDVDERVQRRVPARRRVAIVIVRAARVGRHVSRAPSRARRRRRALRSLGTSLATPRASKLASHGVARRPRARRAPRRVRRFRRLRRLRRRRVRDDRGDDHGGVARARSATAKGAKRALRGVRGREVCEVSHVSREARDRVATAGGADGGSAVPVPDVSGDGDGEVLELSGRRVDLDRCRGARARACNSVIVCNITSLLDRG